MTLALLLVLAVSALIFPVRAVRRTVGREGAILTGATVLFGWLCCNGQVSPIQGGVLLASLGAYTAFAFLAPPKAAAGQAGEEISTMAGTAAGHSLRGSLMFNILAIALSLAALAGGSQLFVDEVVRLSLILGVSEAVIGLTVVAVGTAEPKIVTAAAAA